MSADHGVQTEQELYNALDELREEPYGTARSARTEELVEAAERFEFDEALPLALIELLTAYQFGNESRKSPVLFGRLLKLYQEKPESFNDRAVHGLFWCFKWITTTLLDLPEIPLASIEGWIAQMKTHYVAAGKPMHAVHTSRFKLASHTGTGLDAAYEQWATRPRDEFSDCEACEARTRGVYWANREDHARALREWEPVLAGKLTCAEEPVSTIAYALLSLVREGRLDDAVSLHRSGYRSAKTEVAADSRVGRHLEFLALTGNSARGLELLAENRRRFDSTTDPHGRLAFLDGVRVLLTRLVAEGAGDAPVAGPGGRAYTVDSLLAEVAEQTDELARRFDERNGTTYQGDIHRGRCARQPLTSEPLALGVRVKPVAEAATVVAVPVAAPRPAVPEDFATLLAEAREAIKTLRPDHRALWNVVAERATEEDIDDLLRAELATHEGNRLAKKRAWNEAAAARLRAADLYDQAGKPGHAVVGRTRAEWCAFLGDEERATRSWTELDDLLAQAEVLLAQEQLTPGQYVAVRHARAGVARAILARATEDVRTDARARFETENDALLQAAVRFDIPSRAATADGFRSNVLMREGRIEEALTAIESGVAYAERAQRPWTIPQYLAQQGHLLNRLGRLDEAAPVLHRALALAVEWPGGEVSDAKILMELAQNRMNAHDLKAAVTHLTSAAARFDRLDRPVPAANARAYLGQALRRDRRHADAAAVLESLITEEAEAQLAEEQRAQIRLDLGLALMASDEPRAAAEVFARLADFVAGWKNQGPHTLTAGHLVSALYAARLWDQGEKAIERALSCHEVAPEPAVICKALRVAAEAEYENRGPEGVERALDLLRRSDEVNEAAEEVEGHYRRWPETGYNGNARFDALVRGARHEEALLAANAAIAAWQLGGREAIGQYASAVLNAAIVEAEQLGRRRQAAARLSGAISRCREAGHQQAVTLLTEHAEKFQG